MKFLKLVALLCICSAAFAQVKEIPKKPLR
jgi:hypothetical protein